MSRFSIGDEVVNSGKTEDSPIHIGTIVGIIPSKMYIEIQKAAGFLFGDSHPWDDIFDNWRSKHVYVVELNVPSPAIELNKYRKLAMDALGYVPPAPKFNMLMFAEDDLMLQKDQIGNLMEQFARESDNE